MASSKAVFGVFVSESQVSEALQAFQSAGYRIPDISVLVPGQKPSGPLGTAIAASGGLLGGLASLGLPDHDATRYERCVRSGGMLISVRCDNADWAGRAKKILRDTGAEEIGSAN
jgi:hypothetical protein